MPMQLNYSDYISYRKYKAFYLKEHRLLNFIKFRTIFILILIIGIIFSFKELNVSRLGNSTTLVIYRLFNNLGFTIENIYLEGQNYANINEITSLIEKHKKQSIFSLDIWWLKNELEKNQWILAASVVKEYPSTLHIRIIERQPIAIWQKNNQHYLLDEHGAIIKDNQTANFTDLPVITGDGSKLYGPKIIRTINNFNIIKKNIISLIRVGNRRWNIRIKNGPEIKLPENNLDQALHNLIQYHHSHNLLNSKYESIDLRVENKIYLKKR
jgi:cell division protein FtsQ